jgi:nucleotide-binding universal stress UspA family protein
VADTGFAGSTNESLSEVLDDELARLGRTMLYIARTRAREQGISAHAVVRHGAVSEVVEDFVREVDASLLVMGTPQENSGHQSFKPGRISEFAERVRATTGVEVLVVS